LPVSLNRYAAVDQPWFDSVNTWLPGNGGVSGAAYWFLPTFRAQLPGPFPTVVRTGLTPTAGSLNAASPGTIPDHSHLFLNW